MFNLSKNLIGVERKPDGSLIYQGRGFYRLLCKKSRPCLINQLTYSLLKRFAIVEVLLAILLIIYLKSSPFNWLKLFILLCLSLIIDSFNWYLKSKIVQHQEKNNFTTKER